jgi:hypothetical protein
MSNIRPIEIKMDLLWAVVFVVLFFTGNCATCGGDVNYVQQWVDAPKATP